MNLTRCNEGHFYDAERFNVCPHCNSGQEDNMTVTSAYEDEKTGGVDSAISQDTASLKEKIDQAKGMSSDDQATFSFYKKTMGSDPVVGWLICIEGNHVGQDFRLKGGRNFIGRSPKMDVALTDDQSISREKHMIILYEPKMNVFMVQPGDSKELSYLNDNVILSALEVKAYDVLMVGESKLMFIPFCGAAFQWDDVKGIEAKQEVLQNI